MVSYSVPGFIFHDFIIYADLRKDFLDLKIQNRGSVYYWKIFKIKNVEK